MKELTERITKLFDDQKVCFGLILFASAAFYAFPVFVLGLPRSIDLEIHLGFFREIQLAVTTWDIFPGWAFDNGGYGNVGIRLYPPISSYTLVALGAVTRSLYDAVWLTYFVWMVVGCLGIFLFARDIGGSKAQATTASLLYAIMPFPLAEFCQMFLVAEFIAGSIIPFCFLFATRVCRRGELKDVLLLGVSLSLLILAHIPLTILAGISLVIYVLLILDRQRLAGALLRQFAAIALALSATAFYWVKLVREASWTAHYDPKYFADYFSFRFWLFPSVPKGDAFFSIVPHKLYIDLIIALTALLILPFIFYWFRKPKREEVNNSRILSAIGFVSLFALFMTSKASYPIWYSVTSLQKVQFPFRWLSVVSVLAPITLTLSISHLVDRFPSYRSWLTLIVAVIVVTTISFDIRQTLARPGRVDRTEFLAMADEAFRSSNNHSRHWWPKWAKKEALTVTDPVVAEGRDVEVTDWSRYNRAFKISEGQPTQVRVATFYYPLWRASVNGIAVETGSDDGGAIVIPVDSNASRVDLRFEEPTIVKAAGWTSLLSWLGIGLVGIVCLIKRFRRST
jgi:hypothetical protein